jgi:membrane-associated phospholipid phosphatase
MSWQLLTRLGEAQILVPTMLLGLAIGGRTGLVANVRWWACTAVAAGFTLASKLAFIGWGWGWAWADFTGVSGHTLFASAVLPPLALLLTAGRAASIRRSLVTGAVALALAVGVSRVLLGAHSVSEVLAGWLLGGAAAALAAPGLWRLGQAAPVWPAVALLAWAVFALTQAGPTRSHERVTDIALRLSGRSQPYVRADLHRDVIRTTPRPPVRELSSPV